METSSNQCAAELLETVPQLMRIIRTNVRAQSGAEFSMVQFRALAFLGRNDRAMLSDVATFLGLTLPATSKLVDGLVNAKLVTRDIHSEDRRRVSLELTTAGQRKYAAVVSAAREFLAEKMRVLSETERATVLRAMRILQRAVADAPDEERKKSRTT